MSYFSKPIEAKEVPPAGIVVTTLKSFGDKPVTAKDLCDKLSHGANFSRAGTQLGIQRTAATGEIIFGHDWTLKIAP